jgi:hypothetical protein
MMADRKRKSALNLDPAVSAWQKGAAENRAALTEKQKRDRQRTRIYIDVDEELKAVIEAIAGRDGEDTSMSQAAELLLSFGAVAYIEGEDDVRAAFREGRVPARTPRFGWNVSIPDLWQRILDGFGLNGQADGQVDG